MALLISNQDVEQVLDIKDLPWTRSRRHQGIIIPRRARLPARTSLLGTESANPQGYYQWGSMEGTSRHYGVFATRIIIGHRLLERRRERRSDARKVLSETRIFCGLILLFSTENGEPLAVINDGYLQHQLRVRVATAGIAAKYLAPRR